MLMCAARKAVEQAVQDSGGHREIEEPAESVCWAEVA